MKSLDLWTYEREQWAAGIETVCGVDEAGAGPLAGPVYAAAVILPREIDLPGLNDSKKLTAKRREALYDLILCCICGGMSPLYRRLYDEGLVNPGFGGEVLRVDGCCCILFTGESDDPDTVCALLQDEIERVRAEGVDREVFTLCKNEKYGQLVENLENFSFDKEIELTAEDIRLAARALGKITGQVEVDEILDKIFGSFCIGK